MIGIPLGLLTTNAAEWVLHRYVLHKMGKKRDSFWSFHFHEHHQASRRNEMIDDKYEGLPIRWDAQGKEVLGLVAATLPFLPLAPVAPFFVGTLIYGTVDYYMKHRRAHRD